MTAPATFRAVSSDGSIHEIEMTEEQARTLMSSRPIAYHPRNPRIRVENGSTVVRIESAIPVPAT